MFFLPKGRNGLPKGKVKVGNSNRAGKVRIPKVCFPHLPLKVRIRRWNSQRVKGRIQEGKNVEGKKGRMKREVVFERKEKVGIVIPPLW